MTQENSSETTPAAKNGSSDLFNNTAGWVLFAAGLGLGLSILAGKYFHGNDPEMPENPGYAIEVAGGEDGGQVEMTFPEALTLVTAADGEKVFAKCQACHNIAQGGPNGVGPNLHGIMGAAFASKAGFNYSSALSGKSGTWGWDEMNQWLEAPRAYVEGTTMSFAGLGKIEDRAALALYLNENGSNLPVPEYTPPPPEEADEELDGPGEGPGMTEGADVDAVEAAGAMGDEQPVPENPGQPVQ